MRACRPERNDVEPSEQSPERDRVLEVAALVRQVSTNSNRYADTVRRRLELARSDMTAMELISSYARAGAPISPGELAQRLRLSASAVTSLVDRLERVGHVERSPDVRDRRRQQLRLTDSADELASAAFLPLGRAIRAVLQDRSDAELEAAAAVLHEVLAVINALTNESEHTAE